MMDKIETELMQKVASQYGVTPEQVKDIYDSQFSLMREVISNIDFNVVKSEEEFNALKKNFTLPRLMKFYADYRLLNKYLNVKE